MNPLWTLAPLSIVLGAFAVAVFRRTTDREAVRSAVNRIQAHLLEFWIFADEPSLVWKSWGGLIASTARLYRLLFVPLILVSVPMVPLFFFLEEVYGSVPLEVGKSALVTLRMNQPLDEIPKLQAAEGISIESAVVRVWSAKEISWRIRPERPLTSELQWVVDGKNVTKAIYAGGGFRYHSFGRTRPSAGHIRWIEISYPASNVSALGLDLPWWLWFVAFSVIGSYLSSLMPDGWAAAPL